MAAPKFGGTITQVAMYNTYFQILHVDICWTSVVPFILELALAFEELIQVKEG